MSTPRRPLQLALDVADRFAEHERQFDLARVARYVGLAEVNSDPTLATIVTLAEHERAPERVINVLKAAIGGATMDSDLAGEFRGSVAAFLQSLRNHGVFDALAGAGAVSVPWQSGAVAMETLAGGSDAEGAAKRIRAMGASAASYPGRKASCICVLSEDLFREAGPQGISAINNELRSGVIASTDAQALTVLTTGATSIGSAGTIIADVAALLANLTRDNISRLLFVVGAAVRDQLDATPAVSLPKILQTAPIVASDELTTDSMLAIVANSCVVADGGLRLDSARQTSLQMADDPSAKSDSPPVHADTVSLWMTNAVALRAERRFRLAKVRAGAAAIVTDIDWYGGSP